MDFSSTKSVLNGLLKILNINVGGTPSVPTPLILIGGQRKSGLSAQKMASEIIARRAEAGLPVGNLPSGEANPDEIMERIRMEVLVKNLQQEAIIKVAIPPGSVVTAAGVSAAGPVTVAGSTTTINTGYGQIQ
jgi:hypothetical protein